MRKRNVLLVLFICVKFLNAQIITTPDTTVCGNYTTTLQALSAETSSMNTDDLHGAVLPIGFTFNFYGQAYTQLVISGNGYVTFDLSQANTYSPWPINIAIPNPGSMPENAIMAPWHDINTGVSGYINYGMTGVAPNRIFTITWCSIAMFSCTADLFTSQVVLYEGSDKIEMFIQDKPLCTGWNSGAAIQGLVDATSTNFDIVIDPPSGQPRNYPLQWTATNEAWEFLPNGVNAYTISQIAYIPINTGLNTWTDLLGNTLGTGATLPITISTTTSYVASISGSCIANAESDTVTITVVNPEVELGPDIALACNADTTLFPQIINGTYPYSYLWNTISVDSFLFIDSSNVYSLTVIDSNGCQMTDDIIISVFPAPAVDFDFDGLPFDNVLDIDIISCNSTSSYGPVSIQGGTAPYSYSWLNTSLAFIGSSDSILLGDGLYYLIVTDVFGCEVTDTLEITYDAPPSIDLGFDIMIACNSYTLIDPLVFGGTAPYSYLWDSGVTDSMTILPSGVYSVIVSDFYGCSNTDGIEITYDAPPSIDLGVDIMIACNSDTLIDPLVFGGTAPYSYLWDSGSTDSMTTLPSGVYSVTVSDFYGCSGTDNIEITYDIPGTVTLSGGGSICANGTFAAMNFNFNGLLPWDLVFANGLINQTIQGIPDSNYLFETNNEGIYNVVSASDVNDCLANIVGTAQVIVHPLPVAIISPSEISIYEDDSIELEVGEYAMYHWFSTDGLDLDTFSTLTVSDSGIFYVEVIDFNGCSDVSDDAIVNTKPYTNLFIPNTFTPNGDDHNELFVISGVNIKTFNIQIYNRWGELMFMSESIYKSWDGTFANNKVQEGSYYYQIEVEGNDGKIFKKGGVIKTIY